MSKKIILPYFTKSLLVLWFSHIIIDFCTGIWPIYKTIAGIDLAKAGLIAGISGFIGEILQLGFGYFCDRGHRKKILILGMILASSILWITFTATISSSFWILLLLMLGSGSFHPAGMGYAGLLSQEHKGKTILLFASGGALGLGISQIVFTKIINASNGHALILLIPVCVMLIVLAFHKFPTINSASGPNPAVDRSNRFLKEWKPLSLLYLIQIFTYIVGFSLLFLLPDLMMGKTTNQWFVMGGAHLCFILGSACALPGVGFLCDRFGQKKILPYFVAGAFILVPDKPSTVSALLMGCAWCFTSFGPTCAGFLCQRFEEHAVTQALSWMGLLLIGSLFFSLILSPFIKIKEPDCDPVLESNIDPTDTIPLTPQMNERESQ
ncbi:MAG: MFS transporter [Chlamydiia bacterium]|nr:MFS transporter [Chlamydiia bacterium]